MLVGIVEKCVFYKRNLIVLIGAKKYYNIVLTNMLDVFQNVVLLRVY